MTTDELKKVHQAKPFRPFILKLAGGRSLPVKHPEFMAYSPGSRITVVFLPDGDFEIVDLLLVESIRVSQGTQTSDTSRRKSA